ncbi:hypothetical protein GINT2_001002 [Glugoides intestinalis]
METMVSSSNNTQKEIYLWQDLVWSIQPGVLSCIVISIVVFFIMTLLYKKYGYYNNLLNGFLTILLTIISGIIFGKGLEILFRTLHIICSGAYGNVVFSLADIFISLLFGCIFVISGSLLLFNKKLHKLLRLFVDADKGAAQENENHTSEDAEHPASEDAEHPASEKAVDGPAQRNKDQKSEEMMAKLKGMIDYIQTTLDNDAKNKNNKISPENLLYLRGMMNSLKKTGSDFQKMGSDLQKMGSDFQKMGSDFQKMGSDLYERLEYLKNHGNIDKNTYELSVLRQIECLYKTRILNGFKEYKEMLAELAAAEEV